MKKMQINPVKKVHGTPRAFYDDYTSQLRLNEYMLVLLPHEELRNRVLQARKDFYWQPKCTSHWPPLPNWK